MSHISYDLVSQHAIYGTYPVHSTVLYRAQGKAGFNLIPSPFVEKSQDMIHNIS